MVSTTFGGRSKVTHLLENYLMRKLDKYGYTSPTLMLTLSNQINALQKNIRAQQRIINRQYKKLQYSSTEGKKYIDRYKDLYDSAPIGYFNISNKGTIVNANTKAASLLNRRKSELTGKPLSSFVHHSSLDSYFQLIEKVRHNSKHSAAELTFVKKRGMPFYAQTEITYKKNQQGAVTEILVLLVDITERKEYEHALIAEMDRIQVTLHSIGDGVITTDANGIVDYMNPTAENLTGWKLQHAIGNPLKTVFNVVDEETRRPIVNAVSKCMKENRVNSLGKECVLIGQTGKLYAIQNSVAPLRNRNNEVLGVVVVFSNITEARNMAQKIAHQATHDALTGLVNRREFEKRLNKALCNVKEYNSQHSLCYLDLDQFKLVNDTAGHVAGDELLRKLTILLKSKIRSRDTLARHGGDEFSLLLDNCPLDKAYKIANSLVAAVRNYQFEWEGQTFNIGVSIGLVPISAETTNSAQLMSQADVACYTAKDLGRNQVHIYQQNGDSKASRHTEIVKVAGLSDAIKADRFQLYCQSIIPLPVNKESPLHYELLLRAVDTNGKIEMPDTFVPAAERYGMMAAIDRWVISTAFKRHVELFSYRDDINIAINLSGNSLADSDLLNFVTQQISETGIPAENVCFEITETAAISNLQQARHFITNLKQLGCHFALDDFGSGLSSFTYLKNLPVDYLKIDGSFVMDMGQDPTNEAMVAAINEVGHVMGIKTIAECAENNRIIKDLTRLGVDYAQGFAIGAPTPIEIVASKLNQLNSKSA